MLWVSGRPDGHRVGTITATDGETIPFREWLRPDAKAVILYLHGQGDHSGPFVAMGDLLYDMGFSVYAHDQRGFGLSRARRGDIDSYDRFLEDVAVMLNYARMRNPDRPCFLLGLSMGGHLALRAACRSGHLLHGVVALSPGLKLRKRPPWKMVAMVWLYALVDPGRYAAVLPPAAVTTRNQIHLQRAGEDETWVRAFTARFYVETLLSLRRAWREAKQIHVPVLILQAGDDELVCPKASQRFSRCIGHPDVEYRLLTGLSHNLVAEPEMPAVARQVARWIEMRIPRTRSASRVEARADGRKT